MRLPFHAKEQNEVEELGRQALDSQNCDKHPVNMYDLQQTLQVGWYDTSIACCVDSFQKIFKTS